MLSKNSVCLAIDASEDVYRQCWAILRSMRAGAPERERILDFQPKLAAALLRLDRIYHEAGREKQRLIRKKKCYSAQWFRHWMASLSRYQKLVALAAHRGRNLGDLFAWLFYRKEELRLYEHLRRPPIGPLADRFGTLAEIDLIRRLRLLPGGVMPLYHGTTTILRVGDLSFVDIASSRLVGLGEIKAGPRMPSKTAIHLTTIGDLKLANSMKAMEVDESKDAPPEDLRSYSLDHMRSRLERQQRRMETLLKFSVPNVSLRTVLQTNRGALKGLADDVRERGFILRQISRSLVIAAFKVPSRESLYKRLVGPLPSTTRRALLELKGEELLAILTEAKEDNALWISTLSPYYFFGATPLFWSGLPQELADELFAETMALVTLYNPAHLLGMLRSAGFQAVLKDGSAGMEITTTVRGRLLTFAGTDYYLGLVQRHLVEDSSILALLQRLVKALDLDKLRPGAVVGIMPMHSH